MRRLLALSLACLYSLAWCAPPDLMTCAQALAFAGESTAAGRCSVRVVPAPGLPEGTHTLEVRFRLEKYQANDWLDAYCRPAPGLDLTGSQVQRLWVRAEQPTDWLMVKICDPDSPGANHSTLENALTDQGKPLPAGQWVALDLQLPADPKRRDGIDYLGVYVHAANHAVPLNQDQVFYLGQFPFELPPRPAWPPVGAGGTVQLQPLAQPPFRTEGPWLLVKDENNQTDHPARIVDGAVVFDADANGWNEYLWSDPAKLPIKPLTTYRLQFDYEILRGADGDAGACFYSLVRAKGTIQEDVGWARWSPPTGSRGTRIITFTTHDAPGYYLNFGIRNQGQIRLANLSLSEVLTGKGGAQ